MLDCGLRRQEDININIVECKFCIYELCKCISSYININIVECKWENKKIEMLHPLNININIVECKSPLRIFYKHLLVI